MPVVVHFELVTVPRRRHPARTRFQLDPRLQPGTAQPRAESLPWAGERSERVEWGSRASRIRTQWQTAANSLFHNILGFKSLFMNILRTSRRYTQQLTSMNPIFYRGAQKK